MPLRTSAQSDRSFQEILQGLSSQVRDLASEVHLAELQSAVRKQDGAAVSRWGKLCAESHCLDARGSTHSIAGLFALNASPLWFAVYRQQIDVAEALLRANGDPNTSANACLGRSECTVGGQSALHVALSRGSADCVRRLLEVGASPDDCLCFPVDEKDEPEWDEASSSFSGGLSGLTALQLAAVRSDERLCELLLSHGAEASDLGKLSEVVPEMVITPALRPLLSDDGEAIECPICMDTVVRLTAQWTPCCLRAFHKHCLDKITTCPMCRQKLTRTEEDDFAWVEGSSSVGVSAAELTTDSSSRRPHNSLQSTALHNRALELAFSGEWFDQGDTGARSGGGDTSRWTNWFEGRGA